MKEDRFLTGILVGIALLVVASLTLFFLRKDTQTYLPEDGPEAIVHNYIFALEQEDYERAYTYLAEDEHKPSYSVFLRDVILIQSDSVQIGDAEVAEETASVQLTFTQINDGILVDRYEYQESALLVKQDSTWKILDITHHFWSWDWYEEK